MPAVCHKSRVVVLFRNDLRIHDNALLTAAAQSGAEEVIPVFCVDERFFGTETFLAVGGGLKASVRRTHFLFEALRDLKQNLRELGSDLDVILGRPELAVSSLKPDVVIMHSEFCSEEKDVESGLKGALEDYGGRLQLVKGGRTMYHEDDMPESWSNYFKTWRKQADEGGIRPPLASVTAGSLPWPESYEAGEIPCLIEDMGYLKEEVAEMEASLLGPCALRFEGGETAGLARVKYYLWDSNKVATYKKTRNGLLGGDYSTKFSPWLALGCLSARHIHAEILRYQAVRKKGSSWWVLFELKWRDYFLWYASKNGNRIFMLHGPKEKPLPWVRDDDALERWKTGNTGIPFVDANMRELLATGFMSNRGRQNTASFLVHNLKLDWRLGAEHFEEYLLDHDPAVNWGNWATAAGVAHDRQYKFNCLKQGMDYDRNARYIKLWVPELAHLPTPIVHKPWTRTADERAAAEDDYPLPAPGTEPRLTWTERPKRKRKKSALKGGAKKTKTAGTQPKISEMFAKKTKKRRTK